MITVEDIQRVMNAWAPPAIAWEDDNPGLQCGDPKARVRGILVSLDPTEASVREAEARGANMLVTHHPLLFHPLHSVTPATVAGRCLEILMRRRIALYSAHTNLDFASGGTSHALAALLGVQDVSFLERTFRVDRKIVTFVPAESADRVAAAMAGAGAGVIGNYDNCSFRSAGTGTFRGNDVAAPVVGRPGRLEHVPEVRLEMIAPQWSVEDVIRAMRAAHPYEEVAFDVIPLENFSDRYGMGVVGTLPRAVPLSTFLASVKAVLGTGILRWCGSARARVRRIALCGGSGGRLLGSAIRACADVFVSADLKYHTFQEAAGRIALVDAGHYETEAPVVGAIVARLHDELHRRGDRIPVFAARRVDNVVRSM